MNKPNKPSQPSPRSGKAISVRARHLLIALWLICAVAISGCQSNSQMRPSGASQATVDPSLMVEPNYEATLLQLLSSKPNEQTPK
ncbi:Rz1-like protein [Pseudomonas phage WRT]|uniref:Rz1-like protein n=1 Tax=Pseudomonas phage WRT TaxID=2783803 RepID=A0A1W6JRV4_9CAUD|nr:Rz-like spanin [Pseudomonas phage WRT]ARM69611.1 Rz1-like protein [Pseudomonas phage WRT]